MEDQTLDIKNTVLELIEDLRDNIFTKSSEKGDLLLVEFYFKKMAPVKISDHVVTHVLPYKGAIENRHISFFKEKKYDIFKGLPQDKVDYFSRLVENSEEEGGLSEEDKNVVWSYFDTLSMLAERYKKYK